MKWIRGFLALRLDVRLFIFANRNAEGSALFSLPPRGLFDDFRFACQFKQIVQVVLIRLLLAPPLSRSMKLFILCLKWIDYVLCLFLSWRSHFSMAKHFHLLILSLEWVHLAANKIALVLQILILILQLLYLSKELIRQIRAVGGRCIIN